MGEVGAGVKAPGLEVGRVEKWSVGEREVCRRAEILTRYRRLCLWVSFNIFQDVHKNGMLLL